MAVLRTATDGPWQRCVRAWRAPLSRVWGASAIALMACRPWAAAPGTVCTCPKNAALDAIRRTRPSWCCPAPRGGHVAHARDDFTARIPTGQRANLPEMDLCIWRVHPMDLGRQLSSRVVAMTGELRAHLFAEAAAMIAAEMPSGVRAGRSPGPGPDQGRGTGVLGLGHRGGPLAQRHPL